MNRELVKNFILEIIRDMKDINIELNDDVVRFCDRFNPMLKEYGLRLDYTKTVPTSVFLTDLYLTGSKDYIMSKLDGFYAKAKDVNIRYMNEEDCGVHFIEIVPTSDRGDIGIYGFREELLDEFKTLYPRENICFVNGNLRIEWENVLYKK